MSEIRELERAVPFTSNGTAPSLSGMAFTVLQWLGVTSHLCPPYWSTARDIWLRRFYERSDYLKIATGVFVEKAIGVPLSIVPRDYAVKAHVALANQIEVDIIRNSGLL